MRRLELGYSEQSTDRLFACRSVSMVNRKKPLAAERRRRAAVEIGALTDLERQRLAHEKRAAQVSRDPLGERADRFSMNSPEMIEMETRNVRLDMTFTDLIKIRDQALMVKEIMDDIIAKSRERHLGTIKQRMQCRQIADAGRRHLARFNGKTPHGDTYKRKEQVRGSSKRAKS